MKEISQPIKFVELSDDSPDQFCVSSFGEEGSGKSRFAATFPSPIGLVALDRKARFTISKHAKEFGKKVVAPSIDLIRTSKPLMLAMMKDDCGTHKKPVFGDPMPECCSSHYYRWHVNRIKEAAFTLAEMPDSKCRSIIIDSGSQLKEDVMFANYGRSQKVIPRDRGAFNQEMIDFMNAISAKHVLITHKAKDEWKGDNKTGGFERNGFNQMGYHCNVEVFHHRAKKAIKNDDDEMVKPFYIDVVQCQANPELVGDKKIFEDDLITFQNLAIRVFPDSEAEDWE